MMYLLLWQCVLLYLQMSQYFCTCHKSLCRCVL